MNRRPQLFGKTLFVDLMMGTLVVVTALLIASNAAEKAKKQKAEQQAGLRTEGKYAIIMEWPNKSPDDVDLYVRDPAGNIAFFNARDLGLMHLDHDDQGTVSDKAQSSNGTVSIELNEERVILRGIMEGEYTVNVHMYDKRSPEPTPVTVSLYRLKGEDTEVLKKVRTLVRSGDEQTAFRFTVKRDESLTDVNDLQRSLVGAVPQQRGPRGFVPGGGF
ncbi:MAG TPA: hypothetical protein VL426_04370 [Candidatus Binatia bacterium]|jgi:hypothetical protein|nr:hypothetical protein [Candidatus Binatia bacterium]